MLDWKRLAVLELVSELELVSVLVQLLELELGLEQAVLQPVQVLSELDSVQKQVFLPGWAGIRLLFQLVFLAFRFRILKLSCQKQRLQLCFHDCNLNSRPNYTHIAKVF